MDSYDLSNLPLLGHCADSGEHHPWFTDEENRLATFSRRSVTVTTSEQAERQQILSTGDEQISEQKALADFDISSPLGIFDPLIVNELEDPFAALAAYRPLTFDDNPQPPFDSELGLGFGLLKGFTAEDITDLADEDLSDIVLAEPEGNNVLELPVQPEQQEQPEQPQGESEKGIVVPESASPDTVPGKRSGKWRASQPRELSTKGIPKSSIEHCAEMYFQKSLGGSEKPTKTRQKLDSTVTEFSALRRGIDARSQSAAKPEESADSQKNTEQNPEESLKERVEKETAKWVVRLEPSVARRFMCSYLNCGSTYTSLNHLKRHIFKHIGISVYKCPYPECSDKPYFRDSLVLHRHVLAHQQSDEFYLCTLCNKRFEYLNDYKEHVLQTHKKAKSAHSQKNTEQSPEEPLEDWIKKEIAKWVLRRGWGAETRYVCAYPNCGSAYTSLPRLKVHIFKHIDVSVHIKRQGLDGTETEFLSLPRGMAARSQSAVIPEKSADSQKNEGQKPDESLKERVKKETAKWVVQLEPGVKRRYACSHPNCGSTYTSLTHLKRHIFRHIGISIYKCTYPECNNKTYFRDNLALRRHVKVHHESDKFYFCTFCNKRFRKLNNCKEHVLQTHKTAI